MWSDSWRPVASPVSPSADVTLVAVQLRLRTGADPDVLSSWAERLRPELDLAPDLAGYALRLTGDGLLAVSAWTRRGGVVRFQRSPLHTAAGRELYPLLHPPVVDVWRSLPAHLPPTWDEVERRLRAAAERTRSRLTGP